MFVVTHQASLLNGVADEFVNMEAGLIVSRSSQTWERSSVELASITRGTLLKDLRLEWRSKDAINSMLFFSLLVVVIFSFAFNPTAEESRRIAGGLIWVAFLFAAVVALNQTWARELRNQVMDAYRVSPAPANGLFLAKVLGNFIFVSVLEALMTPLFVIFYTLRPLGPAYQLVIVAGLGTWALVVNGTFFAAMSLRTRAREIMLPLLLFPILIPALLGMVEATTAILTGRVSANFWIALLVAYDVVFTIGTLMLFELFCTQNETDFPYPALLTGAFLSYALYLALEEGPTEQTMGEVQRIFYYHVPLAWTAFLLFFVNPARVGLYLVRRADRRPDRQLGGDRDWDRHLYRRFHGGSHCLKGSSPLRWRPPALRLRRSISASDGIPGDVADALAVVSAEVGVGFWTVYW